MSYDLRVLALESMDSLHHGGQYEHSAVGFVTIERPEVLPSIANEEGQQAFSYESSGNDQIIHWLKDQ